VKSQSINLVVMLDLLVWT